MSRVRACTYKSSGGTKLKQTEKFLDGVCAREDDRRHRNNVRLLETQTELVARAAAGRPNLYSYLFDLGVNESTAAAFSAVAKKAIEVPQLSLAIRDGLSITKAVRITSVLTKENADELLSFATKATARDLDRKRAELYPD